MPDATGSSKIDAGTGEDTITADIISPLAASNLIEAGSGNDFIAASTTTVQSIDPTTSTTKIGGADGNDTISADIETVSQNSETLTSVVGGNGSDVIGVDLNITGNYGTNSSETFIQGDSGKDNITFNASLVSEGIGMLSADLHGGADSDQIMSSIAASDLGSGDVDLIIRGGSGTDAIFSEITGDAYYDYDATSRIYGGSGSDFIRSSINVLSVDADVELRNIVGAGSGDDTVVLRSESELLFAPNPDHLILNHVRAGKGDDAVSAVIAGDAGGQSRLYGGSGDDEMKLAGGENNLLAGQSGNDTLHGSENFDRLFGGSGKDWLSGNAGDDHLNGGSNVDVFAFDTANDGSDTVFGWESDLDILDFDLIDDNGNGLADDIDAVSVISDNGFDVKLAFNTGTVIEFVGAGTGSVTSVADLVLDDQLQLI